VDAEEDLRSSVEAVLAAIDAGDRVIDGPAADSTGRGDSIRHAA
jgi:hypothetical protein